MRPFRFGISAPRVPSRSEWLELARKAEGSGFSTLLLPDHLGTPSPFPLLATAAEATDELRLGTLVISNDLRHPLHVAHDAATVDILSNGRLELGIGSGWSKPEYELLGVAYETPARADGLRRSLAIMRQAWAGEPSYTLGFETIPAAPTPVQRPHPPLLIGGHGDAILSLAAEQADIVGFTGLTWNGSSLQPTGVSVETIEERVGFVQQVAGQRFEHLELNALVQVVIPSDDASVAESQLASFLGVDQTVVSDSPFALVGDVDRMSDKLLGLRERLGLSYIVVFEPAFATIAPVVARLAGT
jgi:probable F420-dependent oxidoreductase